MRFLKITQRNIRKIKIIIATLPNKIRCNLKNFNLNVFEVSNNKPNKR